MPTVLLALLLGLWNGIGIIIGLSGISITTPLTTGVITGMLIGNTAMGFQIGATCLLFDIGFFTYGGATTPNFTVGAVFGVIIGQTSGYEAGIAMATLLSLLMSQMDILGRATTTVFQHAADKALANNSIAKFEMWTLLGTLPWFLSRFIPVFVGVLMKDNLQALSDFANQFVWISNGLKIVGKALPAVGFALLLSYMDLKKYWPFMIIGYVMYAYMSVGTIGLAIAGCAAAALYVGKLGVKKEAK